MAGIGKKRKLESDVSGSGGHKRPKISSQEMIKLVSRVNAKISSNETVSEDEYEYGEVIQCLFSLISQVLSNKSGEFFEKQCQKINFSIFDKIPPEHFLGYFQTCSKEHQDLFQTMQILSGCSLKQIKGYESASFERFLEESEKSLEEKLGPIQVTQVPRKADIYKFIVRACIVVFTNGGIDDLERFLCAKDEIWGHIEDDFRIELIDFLIQDSDPDFFPGIFPHLPLPVKHQFLIQSIEKGDGEIFNWIVYGHGHKDPEHSSISQGGIEVLQLEQDNSFPFAQGIIKLMAESQDFWVGSEIPGLITAIDNQCNNMDVSFDLCKLLQGENDNIFHYVAKSLEDSYNSGTSPFYRLLSSFHKLFKSNSTLFHRLFSQKNSEGQTPYHILAMHQKDISLDALFDWLLNKDLTPNAGQICKILRLKDSRGKTIFHYLVTRERGDFEEYGEPLARLLGHRDSDSSVSDQLFLSLMTDKDLDDNTVYQLAFQQVEEGSWSFTDLFEILELSDNDGFNVFDYAFKSKNFPFIMSSLQLLLQVLQSNAIDQDQKKQIYNELILDTYTLGDDEEECSALLSLIKNTEANCAPAVGDILVEINKELNNLGIEPVDLSGFCSTSHSSSIPFRSQGFGGGVNAGADSRSSP